MPVSSPADEPPVLKVRKDAEREVRFHYSREQREVLRRPATAKRRKGFFARMFRGGRKSVLSLLLPVLLGALAILIAVRLFSRETPSGHLAGYDVTLRAYAYQDALLASVAVSWKPGKGERVTEAAGVTVRFSTSEEGAGSVSSEPLGGGQAVVRGRLPRSGTERRVIAEVAIGGTALRLSAAVGKP
jgi:hypothetical protein